MTRRQRHLFDLGRIPRAHNQSPAVGIFFDLSDHVVDLIDPDTIRAAPIPPLRAVNAAEIPAFIRPLVPNRDAVLIQIFDVGIATQKPEQLIDNRFDVELFGREKRKSRTARPQIESRLRPEDR